MRRLSEKVRGYVVPSALAELYTATAGEGTSVERIPGSDEIGEWLKDYGADFFAKPAMRKRWVSGRRNSLAGLTGSMYLGLGIWDSDGGYEVEEVAGFKHSVKLPAEYVWSAAKPALPNLDKFTLFVVPLVSPVSMQLFWTVAHYKARNWTEKELAGVVSWSSANVALRSLEPLDRLVSQMHATLTETIVEYLAQKYDVKPEEIGIRAEE